MDPEMDPTKPENDSQSESREQTVQTSDSQPRYNPSITFHGLKNDLPMTPHGALITPIQARVSRDRSDGNVISRAQSPCESLTHIIRSSLCSELNTDTSYICEHTHTHTHRRTQINCVAKSYFFDWGLTNVERRRCIMTRSVYLPFGSF